jgi:hypothetical protein
MRSKVVEHRPWAVIYINAQNVVAITKGIIVVGIAIVPVVRNDKQSNG